VGQRTFFLAASFSNLEGKYGLIGEVAEVFDSGNHLRFSP
jgi:hypothetical protein